MDAQKLEKIIGHTFKNPDLLQEALTHPSLTHERRGGNHHNQRLEFLGDAVLQLVLTDFVYAQFPGMAEGDLTQFRAHLANRHTLCRRARTIHLGDFLLLGKGEESSGGRDRLSNLADAYEALLGALYLDGGMRTVRKFIRAQFKTEFADLKQSEHRQNPKGQLQERLQINSRLNPVYRVVDETGPDHNKHFEVVVEWKNREIGRGQGSSKKQAETAAAEAALAGIESVLT